MNNIRNFSIIAHIDHGKSTLSDRIMEICGAVDSREMQDQLLDSMDLERERGITIKAQAVRLLYDVSGAQFILNLIDTPGHYDFAHEVRRSLSACEGVILVVDAIQGVEAQTLANAYKAIENDLEIVIAINKIDLPSADIDRAKEQVESVIGIDASEAIPVSAKTGEGVPELLNAIISRISPPSVSAEENLQCLLIDSWYDVYSGVVVLVKVKSGCLKKQQHVRFMSNNVVYQIDTLGVFTPKKFFIEQLTAGDIGFFTASIKKINDCKIGDTITDHHHPCPTPLLGFKELQPSLFCSIFPQSANDFSVLKDSFAKLHLNDASFAFEMESSSALGYGFRCGFLGLLHFEIIYERLQREFNLDLVATAPSVIYKIFLNDEEILHVHNPSEMPDASKISFMEEPWVVATIIVPQDYIGAVMTICNEKRGKQKKIEYLGNTALLEYDMPLAEIVFDFHNKLKAASRGYASVDWETSDYKSAPLVKLIFMINAESVDALSFIIHKDRAYDRGREICEKLKGLIPRQQYKIAIQAAVGSKIIARETIAPYRKDVTAKLYGGDVTRKMKLLEKQKRGKKRMQNIGNVNVPNNVFIDVLKIDES